MRKRNYLLIGGGLNSYVNFYKQVGGQSNVNDCKPGVGGWSKTWLEKSYIPLRKGVVHNLRLQFFPGF